AASLQATAREAPRSGIDRADATAAVAPARIPTAADSSFAALVERLSEPEGYFDTDNLISNETSYLHVIGALERLGVTGGAYVGVGPDQNFSYMARIRPEVAFIVDVRRDNLLQHLLFKALFEGARSRAEYLALWTGRKTPERPDGWADAGVEELVAAVDAAPASAETAEDAVREVLASVLSYGLDLSAEDLATIERFHRTFIRRGLDLRFTSHGRPPRFFYPTLRELILARDLEGRRSNYLARPEDFRFLKELQAAHRVVPVVGDLAGPHALGAIGEEARRRGLAVSALYTSNVEFYLMWRGGRFSAFAETVAGLPRDRRSVIIRSCFNRCASAHPRAVPGHYSTQLLQRIDDFVEGWREGGYDGYWDLVTRESLELR
ncbi:MAG TPA: hypothetical protein VLL48_13685, partial [Longimicrobiales bacterium]|nr:hypothetical protein [Longimicrobiales bacterium]